MRLLSRALRNSLRHSKWMPIWLKRFFLWAALGPDTYNYMYRSLTHCDVKAQYKYADIQVRKDGEDWHRIEADWLKTLAKICVPQPKRPKLPKITSPNILGNSGPEQANNRVSNE
jgi:hypothetical protein